MQKAAQTTNKTAQNIANPSSENALQRTQTCPPGNLAKLAAMMNQSPRVQAQQKLAGAMSSSRRTQSRFSLPQEIKPNEMQPRQAAYPGVSPAERVTQMALDVENVETKAGEFLTHHDKETELIGQANVLLSKYSKDSSSSNLKALNDALPGIRDKINERTDAQAAIISEYVACDVEAVRKTFLDKVLAKDASELRPLFDKLVKQTTLGKDVDEKFKHRFLSYVLQSSKYNVGEGRFRELMGLLGDRKVMISTLEYSAPKAGLANPDVDNPKSEKVNSRDKDADKKLLEAKGGNLAEFIKAKRQNPDVRTENPKKDEIGDVQVIMDSSGKLLPVYYGLTDQKEVEAYTSQQFTAIHHELGHVVNSLKGMMGRKEDKYGPSEKSLLFLTDEEELQNISLDQYSDKAFTDELGLPERIAHGAFGGLDKGTEELREEFLKEDFQRWDERTYKVDGRRLELLQGIKALAGKNWKPYTSGKSKPDGVAEIATDLTTLKSTRKDVKEQLAGVKGKADGFSKANSPRRHDATKDFYAFVAGIKFESLDDLIQSAYELGVFKDKWFK